MGKIANYVPVKGAVLTPAARSLLNMDDYFFSNFTAPDGDVNLFISHYYSAEKAYDAHSPLICYPSQGWAIDEGPRSGKIDYGKNTINYNEIITSFNGKRELVLFWYQAGSYTARQVYINKLYIGYNKLTRGNESHGFIRVSTPLLDEAYEETKSRVVNFIKSFHPIYVDFAYGGEPHFSQLSLGSI